MNLVAIWLGDDRARPAWRALLLLMTGTVLWLALTPAPPHLVDGVWDKLQHAAAFAALSMAGVLGRVAPQGRGAALALLMLGLGIAIELLQWFVPGRSSDWHDVVADAVGVAIGLTLAWTAQAAARRAAAQRAAMPG